MNLLIVCTPANSQIEVTTVGPVLERWIEKTQGANADIRGGRKPGLLWAITKFDIRIGDNLSKPEELLKMTWGEGGLLQQTLLERFGKYDWLNNWAHGNPFNNVFLVRKPGFKVPFLDVDETGSELSLRDSEKSQLDLLRRTFAADPDIQKHVRDPEQAWDAMLKLNDGGMERISAYLQEVALPEVKHHRIAEQLNERINHIIHNRFEQWYQSDAAEEAKKKQLLAQTVTHALNSKGLLLGEMLYHLQLPEESIRSIYLSEEENLITTSEQKEETSSGFGFDDDSFSLGDDFNLFDESPAVSSEAEPEVKPAESPFAQSVFEAWIEHLRSRSSDKYFMSFFEFPAQVVEDLIGELITGANRLKLPEKLAAVAISNENSGNKRDQLIDRQVLTMNLLIADFIAWLGFVDIELDKRPNSRAIKESKVFEFHEVEKINGLPKLNEISQSFTKHYVNDWFIAFASLAQANAGHSGGREISHEQNAKLGEVITTLQSAVVAMN